MKIFHLRLVLIFLFFISNILAATSAANEYENLDNSCPICLEDMCELILTDRCGHRFHRECISQCLNADSTCPCPLSRITITDNPIIEEIVAKKLKAIKKLKHGDTDAPDSQIGDQLANIIRQDDLLNAAFMALSVKDYCALDILCSHLLNNRNVCASDTGSTDLIGLHSEIVFHDANQIDYNGNTLLHHAAEKGLLEIVNILLTQPDRINEQNNNKRTPLMLALRVGNFDVAAILAKKMVADDQVDMDGDIALHCASRGGRADIINIILGISRCLYKQNKEGNTPLMEALLFRRFDVAEILADEMDNVDQGNKDDNTALHCASRGGQAGIVLNILGKSHCLNKQNKWKNTPLMEALLFDRFEVAAILADKMVDVDQENSSGDVALHYASRKGRVDIVIIILPKTRFVNKQNNDGFTPLMLAEKYGHNAVAEMIRSFRDRTN